MSRKPIVTPAQKVAIKLLDIERELSHWHDAADSPHAEINLILKHISDIRQIVQGHVIEDSEMVEKLLSGWQKPGA